jgi:hypothetical protein
MGNAYLYLGIFCLCTGFLTRWGLIFIGLHVYGDYTSKYKEQIIKTPTFEQDELSPESRDRLI